MAFPHRSLHFKDQAELFTQGHLREVLMEEKNIMSSQRFESYRPGREMELDARRKGLLGEISVQRKNALKRQSPLDPQNK